MKYQHPLCMQRSHAGFTLIEMIIVMVIVGILAVTAVYSWPGKAFKYDTMIEQIRRDLRYTQTLAMSKGERFRFNFTSTSYWISDDSGTPISHPVTGTDQVIFPSGMVLVWNTLLIPNNYISFDVKGISHHDGTTLSWGYGLFLTSITYNPLRWILISAETGYVSVRQIG